MTNPVLISTPFASGGDKNDIQESTPVAPNNPTWEAGFPVITSTPISEGGLPPTRPDMNGVFYALADNIVHQSKGLMYEFDAAYATKIGGYPLNARLMLTNGAVVQSTIANNTNDPNADMDGWSFVKTPTPQDFGAIGDGFAIDNSAFENMAIANTPSIEAKKSDNFYIDSSSTVTFDNDFVFDGNGCTITLDQRWNLQKAPMWGSQLSAAASKGATVLSMQFMTNFIVGAKILIYQNLGLSGAAIDPYFASVQDDADNGEYSSHINYVKEIDTVNNTITLETPLEFDAPIQTAVYVTTSKKMVFKDVNFLIQGDASGFRLIDNCDNILFDKCSFTQIGTRNNVTLRINTCYNVVFEKPKCKGINLTIEYGSLGCGVQNGTLASFGNGDALLMIWAAATNCWSMNNLFLAADSLSASSITAGVYLGAKTRNCRSIDDDVRGLPYGYRAQWGAVDPQFVRAKYWNPNGIYSLFSDYSHNCHIIDCKLYRKPVRTVGVYGLVMQGNLLDSGWRGEAVDVPLMLDLNRSDDTTMVRPNYSISNNKIIGSVRSWVGLHSSTITSNKMTSLRLVNGGNHLNLKIDDNIIGNFYSQNSLNMSFTNNTVDNDILQNGTIAGSSLGGVHFYSQTVVNMSGNTIKHPTVGILRTTPTAQVNCITESNNKIIAPTQRDTGVTDSAAPTISSGGAYLANGLVYRSSISNSLLVWRYNGSAWVKGFSYYPQLTFSQGSFNNTPNGLTTFATARAISGAVVGDVVQVSTTSADIGEVKGKYFARVTSADTITVYYQDKSGVSEVVPAVSITLTLMKS